MGRKENSIYAPDATFFPRSEPVTRAGGPMSSVPDVIAVPLLPPSDAAVDGGFVCFRFLFARSFFASSTSSFAPETQHLNILQ